MKVYSEPWHSQKSLFKDFQEYLGVFSVLGIFNHTRRHTTTSPEFGKKCPDYVHFWIKFWIQNVLMRASCRKYFKTFHFGSLFLVFLIKCFSKCPSSAKPPLPWKIPGCMPALRYYSFCKMLHIRCFTIFWIRLCLDYCL